MCNRAKKAARHELEQMTRPGFRGKKVPLHKVVIATSNLRGTGKQKHR